MFGGAVWKHWLQIVSIWLLIVVRYKPRSILERDNHVFADGAINT